MLRYDGQRLLGKRQDFATEMLEKFGSHYWDMHRADLQLAMYERARDLGVQFRFSALITKINPSVPELISDRGERFTGDLLIAADGELHTEGLLKHRIELIILRQAYGLKQGQP